jgi:hypothetical protein
MPLDVFAPTRQALADIGQQRREAPARELQSLQLQTGKMQLGELQRQQKDAQDFRAYTAQNPDLDPDRAAIDFWKQRDPNKARDILSGITTQAMSLSKLDPEGAVSMFNSKTGLDLKYKGKEGKVLKIEDPGGNRVFGLDQETGETVWETKLTTEKAKPLSPEAKLATDIKEGFITQEKADEMQNELGDKTFDRALKLRKEYMTDAKEFMKVRDAYGRIKASASDPSPAGDLALIFNYMKVLDPGSVVRESEFATAAGAKSALETAEESGGIVPNFVYGAVNRLLTGQKLLSNQRNDFVSRGEKLFNSAVSQHDKRKKTSTDIAKRWKIDPQDVVVDIGLAEELPTTPSFNAPESAAIGLYGPEQPTVPNRSQAPQGATGWDTEKKEWVY